MKKSIPKVRERESEASILGNVREREFPLTPVHREVTGQDPAVQTDVSSKATNQAQCHAVFRTKSSRSSRIRSVIGFCDTRENTWNVAIPATKATVQQQKIMGIERAARPHVAVCGKIKKSMKK